MSSSELAGVMTFGSNAPGNNSQHSRALVKASRRSRACSVGIDFPLRSYPNYDSEHDFDLAVFINRLHLPQCIATKEYLHVKSISFHLPFDSMLSSGLLAFLAIKDVNDISEPPQNKRLPGDLGIAAGMCRQVLTAHQCNAYAVPVRKWWQVIVFLLRHCVNIETIEVPPHWWNITWYAPRFPKVDPNSRRLLPCGRYRWGKDPVEDDREVESRIYEDWDEVGEDADDEYEGSERSLELD